MLDLAGHAAPAVWLMAALVLVGSMWVVTLRNLFRAALSLGLVLLGVAGLFILLGAEFLAFVQILVYVGAILTLVVFAVMLTAKVQGPEAPPPRGQQWPAAAAAGALFGLFAMATQWVLRSAPAPQEPASLQQLGHALTTTLLLPFEVISLVLVAALVGAVAVAAILPPEESS